MITRYFILVSIPFLIVLKLQLTKIIINLTINTLNVCINRIYIERVMYKLLLLLVLRICCGCIDGYVIGHELRAKISILKDSFIRFLLKHGYLSHHVLIEVMLRHVFELVTLRKEPSINFFKSVEFTLLIGHVINLRTLLIK